MKSIKTNPFVVMLAFFLNSILTLCCVGTIPALGQSKANEVYKVVSPAVVLIRTDKGAGTGFIVDSSGVIVTALHVVDSTSKAAIKTQSGDIFDDVSLLFKDVRRDLAILKINGFDLPTVRLGNSNDVNPGDQVIVVGNPLGTELLKTSISDGIISGIRDLGDGYKVIQITAPISAGNSGGPALSANGDVIGVVVFRLREGQSLNFAVPINYLRGILSSIDANKPIKQWKNMQGLESVFSEKTSANSTRWKSLLSGTTKILKFEGEYIYIETIQPEQLQRLGVFVLAEVKKQGEKYIGTTRENVVQYNINPFSGEKVVTNSCLFEYPIELTLVSSTRIEGRILSNPDNAKIDWKKCTFSKPSKWENFVWIPE